MGFVGVATTRALLFGVRDWAPDLSNSHMGVGQKCKPYEPLSELLLRGLNRDDRRSSLKGYFRL